MPAFTGMTDLGAGVRSAIFDLLTICHFGPKDRTNEGRKRGCNDGDEKILKNFGF